MRQGVRQGGHVLPRPPKYQARVKHEMVMRGKPFTAEKPRSLIARLMMNMFDGDLNDRVLQGRGHFISDVALMTSQQSVH